MMKRMGKYAQPGRILALLLCLLLLIGMLPSFGALGAKKKKDATRKNNTGSLHVILKDDIKKKLPANARIEFTLYQIGKAAPETAAGWTIDSEFERYKILQASTSDDLGKAATALAKDIVGGNIKGTTKALSNDGVAVFSGLSYGIYLGVLTHAPKGLSATPFIATIPARDPETKELRKEYDVTVKGSYEEPTPSPTTKPSATPTVKPSATPTVMPSATPTVMPSATPTTRPSATPTTKPSATPTTRPSATPTTVPSATPTTVPSATPTTVPSATPTTTPTTPPEGGGGGGDVPQPTAVPTVDISGTKVWDDEGNVHKVRPDSIEVKLLADGSPVNAEPSWSKSGDRWTFTFSGLPKVDSTGNEISYTVVETPVDMYETSISGLTITNKLIEKEPTRQTEISGEKTWRDNDNAKGKRPTSITVHLLRDGVVIDSRTVTAGTGWKYTFGDLPVDDGYGNVYTYELREDGVPGYYSRVDGTNLINSLIDGSTPPTPTDDDETPPPGGTTPNTPEKPEDIPERKSGTPVPQFEDKSDEELEELFDIFGYNTPLYGILGTGDQIPVWVWVCVGIGIAAIILFIVLGRKKKRRR